MSTVATYQGEFGTLVVEMEFIEITSNSPRPDKGWRHTDAAGHEHHWRDGYPTLARVVDRVYWCADCGDEHDETHLECPLCHETVEPGMVGPPPYREFVPGRTSYRLDGRPVSETRAKEIVEAYRASRP
jgi:hypothetical protein